MDKGSGPGRKRGQDTHPGLLPVATQAASEQAGLRAPPPRKAVLTFSPMVNSSIPIMVKRHRWMASSSPTLGKDGAQHSTAQATPKEAGHYPDHSLKHGHRVPSSPEDFSPGTGT